MWNESRAAKLLRAQYPILQGPFGGNLSSARLVTTVSNAGGVGGYGAYTLSPHEIEAIDREIKSGTDKPYNLNLWVSDSDAINGTISDEQFAKTQAAFKPFFDELGIPVPSKPAPFKSRFENQVDVILHQRPPVFSFVFGIPSADILEQCHRSGIITVGAATTVDEAVALEAAGVDLIIASGFESGGHRPSFLRSPESSLTGTFVLVQLIREKVKVPVIAAGGIADAKGIAAAFALGADGVQIGTAFLACDESNATDVHRQMLFSSAARHTTLSRAFTGRLGRGIMTRMAQNFLGRESDLLPFPLQSQFFAPLRAAAIEQQKWDMILFWGGQISPILKHKKADELMRSLIVETTVILK
ncbi:MAG TPA: nitronate monooxygenase [Chryseosolibacter sp.]